MRRLIFPLTAVLVFSAVNTAFAGFITGKVFLSSSVTDEVRIYDAETLAFESAFTHPLFQIAPGYSFGPNGMAFNGRGNQGGVGPRIQRVNVDSGQKQATGSWVSGEPGEGQMRNVGYG